MPELPEVEVTRRSIAPLLVGRRVARLRTTRGGYFFLTPPAALRRGVEGRRIDALSRHGKYLLAELEGGARLLLHLGMTGQLFGGGAHSLRLLAGTARATLAPEALQSFRPDRHTHLRFEFEDAGAPVFFRDVRKFGKVQLLAEGEACARLDRLGPDALRISAAELFARSRGRTIPVKSWLIDQSVVAGVGNIYADEALFYAGVRPRRRTERISRAEAGNIRAGLRKVLRRSIQTGGSSISDYLAPDGSDGRYQDERRVYARAGEPCRVCAAKIRRVVISARSAHYCPACQK